jgi:hypothetical protein
VASETILINRAPVLTLWASVVAEQFGFDRDAALSLGKAVAGLTAQSKGRRLGVYQPAPRAGGKPHPKHGLGEEFWVAICGRAVPAKRTAEGVRAVVKDKPVEAEGVERYLREKFGDGLSPARAAMQKLARAFPSDELASTAFSLYERFRPAIPAGTRGWGARGELDLDRIRSLAEDRS